MSGNDRGWCRNSARRRAQKVKEPTRDMPDIPSPATRQRRLLFPLIELSAQVCLQSSSENSGWQWLICC
jgi:hypothetical protein